MSDFSHLADFFAAPSLQRPFENLNPQAALIAPFAERGDVVAESLKAFHFALIRDPGNEREAMLCAIERLRDEVQGPALRGPRRKGQRISAKKRRALLAQLDRVILEGRGVA